MTAPTSPIDLGLTLLEQALDYTRGVLGDLVRAEIELGVDAGGLLTRPTPCAAWSLGRLLAHMDDSLHAFAEGAGGEISLDPTVPAVVRAEALRRRACDLLGAWSARPTAPVRLGAHRLPAAVVAATAALEVTVHGWDVAASLALGRAAAAPPPPAALAAPLLTLAREVVAPDDRPHRFGPARAVPDHAGAATLLLAHLGRDRFRPVPLAGAVPETGPARAS